MLNPRERAKELYNSGMQCCCDLDRWEPERSTGHSHVCRIHKAVIAERNAALIQQAQEARDVG
jgi:hypothetical protein